MKKTKIFAVILSTGLMLGALAGCNDTKASETSVTSTETTHDVIRFTDDDTKVIDPAAVTEPVKPATESVESVISPEPAGDSVMTFDAAAQEKANIFISNFAEVFFADFDAGNINTKQLLNFAHIHYKINARDKIKYENKGNSSFETFAYKDASTTVGRYFGIGLSEDELKKLPAPAAGEQGPFYENGKIWYPTADGENYNLIAVVDSATSNSDGTFTFYFTVYSIDWNTYSNFKEGDIKKYYKLTSAKAASDKTLTKVTSGTAKVGVGQSGNYFLLVYNTVK